ncbi:MAG: hypothetical protein IH594_05495 [Bacteroidales bacterium]|nr:hypothetical protein [Bacteroidales bacterium]
MVRKIFSFFLVIFIFLSSGAQNLSNTDLSHMQKPSVRKEIQMPDIPGYKTLKCDFHMHTVFSDGLVWPAVRVNEAWEEGLDAIAITDHIEHLPFREYLKGDHNASFNIAKPLADQKDIILIRAGEITRSMPPGHLNGLFLKDVNTLDTPEPEAAIRAVADQGGFIFWNHPGWKAQQPDTCVWMEMHQKLYEEGLIHGIEVFNSSEWYPLAVDWCMEKDLAVMGNSDVHGVIAHFYDVETGHRPMTLVFAKDRSEESIKEAMFARRTVAWFDDKMVGTENLLKEILTASVKMTDTGRSNNRGKVFKVKNSADIPFFLSDDGGFEYVIPALAETYLTIPGDISGVQVANMFVGTGKLLGIDIPF